MSTEQFTYVLLYLTGLDLALALGGVWVCWWLYWRPEKARQAAAHSLYAVLTQYQCGVHKRIDEIREITEAIEKRAPGLFEDELALVSWLRSTDDFLCKLRDTGLPPGHDPEQDRRRELFAASGRPPTIYGPIEDRSYEALKAKARSKGFGNAR